MPRTDDISLSAYADPVARVYEEGVPAPRILLRIVTSEYSAHHLQVLEGLEAVRKRPGMYIGSTDSRGLMHCLWEIIDNSVDEALGGHGNAHRHRPARRRQRRGARPRRAASRSTSSPAPVCPASRSSSRSSTPAASSAAARTRHPAVCTASAPPSSTRSPSGSTSRSTAAARPGRCRSTAASPASSPNGAPSGCRRSPRSRRAPSCASRAAPRKGVTGTRIRYWADRQIFTKDAAFHLEELEQRARQTAFLVPGLEIVDPRSSAHERASRDVATASTAGISEFAEFLAPDAAITDTWRLTGTGTFTETVPVLQPTGAMVPDRGRARVPRRHRRAVGDRLRHRDALVRQHHRHAQGRHAPAGLRAGADEGAAHPGRAERPAPQGRQRQAREGRHPRGA